MLPILIAASALVGDVTFHAVGNPGFVTIDGDGGKATCTIVGETADCQCDLDGFDSGIELRNKHMREKYLEVGKYPKATLHVDSAKDGTFKGKLTLKAKTKPVTGTFTLDGGNLEAKFSISLEDYDVGVPSYLGVTVAKDVAVTVKGKVQ